MAFDIGRELQSLKARLDRAERSPRLSHASIDNTSVEIRDSVGGLKGLVGVQADGTTAVNIVNGAAPPVPATPTASPALGGVAVGWDGTFTDASVTPLDWARVEVHASATAGFTPTPDTLAATIETPQGGICYIPVTGPTYVRLLARNTSGTASDPTTIVGPYSPRPVAGEIGIGEIVSTMISDGSVTTPKLFANAVTTPKLAAGSVDATSIAVDALTGKTITGGTITGALIQTAASGQRITLNEANANKVLVYNSSGTAIGELSSTGLLVKGTNGAILWLDPNNAYPNLRLTNLAGTNSAVINVSEPVSGNANLGMNSGTFSGSSWTDVKWRTYMGADFWVAERIRDSDAATNVGGRVFLDSTHASVGYQSTVDSTQNATLSVQQGLATLSGARMVITPPASANSGLLVSPASGHTGYLTRIQLDGADRFLVDKDGNVTVAGNLTVTGNNGFLTARKTTDTSRTSTTTLANDPQLTFSVAANSTYLIDGFIKYSGPGDVQLAWALPSGALGEWSGFGNGTSVVSGTAGGGTQQDASTSWGYTMRTESTDISLGRTYGGITTTPFAVHIRGTLRVGATAGTFALQWAQGGSNATASVVYTDSHLRLQKVP